MGKFSTSNGQLVKKDVHEEPMMRISSKKDRHSKINTSRGPRDRRMRLSLDVAKKFFQLQDMLGFDKASKTVEWLLMESKTAIQELFPRENRSSSLVGVSNSASSASECEVLSGIGDQSVVKTGDDQLTTKCKSSSSSTKEKKKTTRGVRKSSHPLAKETMEMARARARERTMEKRSTKVGCGGGGGGNQYSKLVLCLDQVVTRLGNWNLFGENEVQTMNDQPETPSSHFQFKQPIVGENSSLMTTNWSPSLYNHNTEVSHEHQFNDFQMLSKL